MPTSATATQSTRPSTLAPSHGARRGRPAAGRPRRDPRPRRDDRDPEGRFTPARPARSGRVDTADPADRPGRRGQAGGRHRRASPVRALADAADDVASALASSALPDAVDHALTRGERAARAAARPLHALEDGFAQARRSTLRALYRTTTGARAVARSARRAADAPPVIANELKAAGAAYAKGVARSLAMYALAGVAFLFTLVALTVVLSTALDLWLGPPWGMTVVALLYAAVGTFAFLKARRTTSNGSDAAAQHVANARREVEVVLEPVQQWSRDA